jgi:hypothetical protein
MALVALLLLPIIWLMGLPLRLVVVSVRTVLELLWRLITLPLCLLRA